MRRIFGVAVAIATTAATLASAAHGALQSKHDFSVCPSITATTFFGPFATPSGCGSPVFSEKNVLTGPNNTCQPATNSNLGTFSTTQNPLGVFTHVGSGPECISDPALFGPGMVGGTFSFTVAQTGFCTTTRTIPSPPGRFDGVAFPIGRLSIGTYRLTLTVPDQIIGNPAMTWLGSRATGILHVGGTFTETDTNALARPGKNATYATLLQSSLAGPGAGDIRWSRLSTSSAELKGTDYYACGTIDVHATIGYGKRGANGLARVTGEGSLTRGTGNYEGIRGVFKVTGTYSTKTKRATLAFNGTVSY